MVIWYFFTIKHRWAGKMMMIKVGAAVFFSTPQNKMKQAQQNCSVACD
jgi:hypothetical protein